MRRSKIQLSIVLAVISFIIFATNFGGNLNRELPVVQKSVFTNQNSPLPAVNHNPIYIDGDAALSTFIANEGLSGAGTDVSPYVIEDFTIDASTVHGIEIRNTNAYLIIQDCTISGGNSSDYDGIGVYNAENINLTNNDLTGNFRGIHVWSSNNITLSGNTVNYNSFTGIMLTQVSDSILSGNIANNEIFGILMIFSDNNTLSENLMIRAGITLYYCYDNIIDITNKVNEKSVRFYENTIGVHLSGESDVGQVILLNCDDSIIEGLEVSEVHMGITLSGSNNCLISENNISDSRAGIYLVDSRYTTLSGNLMNRSGVSLVGSYDNDIDTTNKVNGKSVRYYENTLGVQLSGETDVGQVILVNCNNSIIEDLYIVDTVKGIYISDSMACSISGNTIMGCFTGIDLQGSNYNTLSGNILSDNNFNGINQKFSNYNTFTMNILCNNDIGINLDGECNHNTIYYNDIYGNQAFQAREALGGVANQWDLGTTGNYWGDDYIIQNPGATNDGTFWDTPYSIDGGGIDNFPLVNPIFTDVDAPVFTVTPEDFSADEGYTGLNISWTATDLNPANYTIEWNETEVVSATTWTSGTEISYNIPEGMSNGNYSITIILSDTYRRMVQHTVVFTVISKLRIPGFPLMTILISMSVAVFILRRKFNH